MSVLNIFKGFFDSEDSKTTLNNANVVNNDNANQIKKIVLSPEEIEEHSWDFLYDITEKVEYDFPEKDSDSVNDIGKSMNEVGVVYYHEINKQ